LQNQPKSGAITQHGTLQARPVSNHQTFHAEQIRRMSGQQIQLQQTTQ